MMSIRQKLVLNLFVSLLAVQFTFSQTNSPAIQKPPTPCLTDAQHKQFDFWVGEWDVTASGQTIATSSIQRIIDSCVIFENYTQANGYNGKSLNFYDAVLGKWRQTWVDGTGTVGEFVGEYKDGAIHYEGESHRKDGRKILRKMIFSSLGADKVRQYSEASTDGGKTWKATFDLIYIRKK